MFQHFLEQVSVVQAIAPAADIVTSNIDSRVINMKHFSKGVFLYSLGAGATGSNTLQLMSSDDLSKTNAAGMAFRYRTMNADGTGLSDYLTATSSGFVTPTGGNKIVEISFQADELPATQPCAFLRSTTSVSSAVTGGATFLGMGSRYSQRTPKNPAT